MNQNKELDCKPVHYGTLSDDHKRTQGGKRLHHDIVPLRVMRQPPSSSCGGVPHKALSHADVTERRLTCTRYDALRCQSGHGQALMPPSVDVFLLSPFARPSIFCRIISVPGYWFLLWIEKGANVDAVGRG